MTTTVPVPPPPPPPAPIPTPDPPTTVVVNLPPEILERLNPVESFPSPGWATIIAAGIAVVAALIAFLGVLLQVRANAREQANDRAAEHARARRAEQSQIVAKAARDANEMWDAYAMRSSSDNAEGKFVAAFNEASLTIELLRLEGLSKSSETLSTLTDEILAAWNDDSKQVRGMSKVIEAFRKELTEQDTSVSR